MTDKDADRFQPVLTNLQTDQWSDPSLPRRAKSTKKVKKLPSFPRRWSQAALESPKDWTRWFNLCRQAWVAKPEISAEEFQPARWFTQKTNVPASRLRNAARSGRLQSIVKGNMKCYHLPTAVELWRADMQRKP